MSGNKEEKGRRTGRERTVNKTFDVCKRTDTAFLFFLLICEPLEIGGLWGSLCAAILILASLLHAAFWSCHRPRSPKETSMGLGKTKRRIPCLLWGLGGGRRWMGSNRHFNSCSQRGTGQPGPDKGPRSLASPSRPPPGLLLSWALFRVGLSPAGPLKGQALAHQALPGP